jgi:folate-binding protein YgfZ
MSGHGSGQGMEMGERAYRAALEGAAYRRLVGAGYVRVGGADRADFLQRQTTNDVRALAEGRALPNVLTSPTARILAAFTILVEGDTLALLTAPGGEVDLAAYLSGKIFFMDKVSVENAGDAHLQLDLIGPRAAERLQAGLAMRFPGLDEVIEGELGGVPVRLIGVEGTACRIVAPSAGADHVIAALHDAGTAPLDEAIWHVLRVEAGLPAPGVELTGEYTPLEVGLDRAVSGEKGCYTGQEIIARQITYDKVTKRLAGLRFDAPVPIGAEIRGDDRRVGVVTSIVTSPRFGEIGLSVLRRPFDEPGAEVTVETEDGEVRAGVVALPFGEDEGP